MTKYHLCFVAGTKVHTADGLKNIEEIRVGDVVVSRSEHDPTGDNSLRRVTELFVTHPKRLLTVRYRIGDTVEELTGTATHPFFVREQAGFVPAEELKVGWRFSLVDGQEATIEEIRETVAEEGASFTTYNFSVEEEHTYFVGPTGVWVHNMGSPCDEAMEVFLKYLADTDNPIIAAQAARNHLVSKIDEATEGAALYQKHLDDLDRLMYDEVAKSKNTERLVEFTEWVQKTNPSKGIPKPGTPQWSEYWTRPTNPRWRLPKNGKWSGQEGHSYFIPDDPVSLGIKPGEVIPFRQGRPDFSQWTRNLKGELTPNTTFKSKVTLTGTEEDFRKMWQTLADDYNAANPGAEWTASSARKWLSQNRLSPHHSGGNEFQLIPWQLHGSPGAKPPLRGVRHQSGAFDLRNQ